MKQRACGLLIAGALLFAVIVLAALKETPPPEAVTDAVSPVPPRARSRLANPSVFDAQSFYQTIISNNLFRPLGWPPPRPVEPYRLIATILPRSANTPPKAIIQTTADDRTYIVTPSESLDASTEVVSIEGKRVVLSTDGQQRTLHLSIGF